MTVDKVELRRLAEATGGITWVASHATSHQGQRSSRSIYHYPTEFHCREIVETPDSDPENNESIHDESSWAFIGAANPAAILSLLDENERIASRLCACRDCCGQGEIYSGRNEYQGHFQPPEPVMDVCGTCGGDGVLGPLEDFEALAAERDKLRSEIADLKSQLSESRANDRTAMGYLADLRQIAGGDDFPSLVRNVKVMRRNSDRYVWLRDYWGDLDRWVSLHRCDEHLRPEKTDSAIDAAMSSAKEKGDD